MKTANHSTKDQVNVLISPIFMVEAEGRYGLFEKEDIIEGNELNLYYKACDKMLKFITSIPRQTAVSVNIVLNQYKEFSEDELTMALISIRDMMSYYKHLNIHFFDEVSAKQEGIIA